MLLARNRHSDRIHLMTPDGNMYCNTWSDLSSFHVFNYDGREITCKKCRKGLRSYLDIIKYNIRIPNVPLPEKLIRYLYPYIASKL